MTLEVKEQKSFFWQVKKLFSGYFRWSLAINIPLALIMGGIVRIFSLTATFVNVISMAVTFLVVPFAVYKASRRLTEKSLVMKDQAGRLAIGLVADILVFGAVVTIIIVGILMAVSFSSDISPVYLLSSLLKSSFWGIIRYLSSSAIFFLLIYGSTRYFLEKYGE